LRRLDIVGFGPREFLFKSETAAIAFPTFVVGAAATRTILTGKRPA